MCWCIDRMVGMMCFCSGSAARLNEESVVTQPSDQVRHHSLTQVFSRCRCAFSGCFIVVSFAHLCPAEIGTFKTETIKILKHTTYSH